MNSKQKINLVVMEINEIKEISPKGERIHINHFDTFEEMISSKEVVLILNKLEKDEKIISNFEFVDGIEDLTMAPLCEYFFYVNSANCLT